MARRFLLPSLVLVLAAVGCFAAAAPASETAPADRALDRALQGLVARSDGPPGAMAVIQRGGHREIHAAGVANPRTGRPMRVRKHMRIASVSKAFSGAAALRLVHEHLLSLRDTIGEVLPSMPRAWRRVTLRELLNHTSGLPDYTESNDLRKALSEHPANPPDPSQLLDFVAKKPLRFTPGSRYMYLNSDNIAVAYMVEAVTGASYEDALAAKVFRPLGMDRTLMPEGVLLPSPFIHGYGTDERGRLEDQSQTVAWGGWAWASGGIVSTPGNLNRFVRAYVGGRLFGGGARHAQFRFIDGAESDPPGPGHNAGGLALFRYRTRCGTLFGHTGSIPGYSQLIAANRSGRRSVVFSINRQAPDSLIPALRRAEVHAVCAALAPG